VFISCTKIESFGKVFIESMACGTPNIGFNCTGHAELILDGYNGYKANPYSYKEIADLIQKVLSLNEKEYCELSKNCLEHVKNYYSNCNVFDLHETLYSNLLKK
jgi:glycosyltransferase involved in cell wall biosynthesis